MSAAIRRMLVFGLLGVAFWYLSACFGLRTSLWATMIVAVALGEFAAVLYRLEGDGR
jgi:hypothetical protein